MKMIIIYGQRVIYLCSEQPKMKQDNNSFSKQIQNGSTDKLQLDPADRTKF